jgi:hypothetical protein
VSSDRAIKLAPGDDETLKKASVCLLQSGQGVQAVELCREIMAIDPERVTAKLGAEWVLEPGGEVLPAAASIKIALVGGDALGPYLHAGRSFGFELGDFNAICPTKVPLYREDLAPVLLSEDFTAFRFDFRNDASFPADSRALEIRASADGLCYGVIQWIHLELGEGVSYENHPSRPRAVTNWQHTVYGFGEPIPLTTGSVVSVRALHDRSRPWFELIRAETAEASTGT